MCTTNRTTASKKSVGERSKDNQVSNRIFIAERRYAIQFVVGPIGGKGYEEVYNGFRDEMTELFKSTKG